MAPESASLVPLVVLGARYLFGSVSETVRYSNEVLYFEWLEPPTPCMTFARFRCRFVNCKESSSSFTSITTPMRPDDVKNMASDVRRDVVDASEEEREPKEDSDVTFPT